MLEYKVKVWSDGTIPWYLNGYMHCEHGPAFINSRGCESYHLNGDQLSKEEWENRLRPTKEMTIEEIKKELGYIIKIVE